MGCVNSSSDDSSRKRASKRARSNSKDVGPLGQAPKKRRRSLRRPSVSLDPEEIEEPLGEHHGEEQHTEQQQQHCAGDTRYDAPPGFELDLPLFKEEQSPNMPAFIPPSPSASNSLANSKESTPKATPKVRSIRGQEGTPKSASDCNPLSPASTPKRQNSSHSFHNWQNNGEGPLPTQNSLDMNSSSGGAGLSGTTPGLCSLPLSPAVSSLMAAGLSSPGVPLLAPAPAGLSGPTLGKMGRTSLLAPPTMHGSAPTTPKSPGQNSSHPGLPSNTSNPGLLAMNLGLEIDTHAMGDTNSLGSGQSITCSSLVARRGPTGSPGSSLGNIPLLNSPQQRRSNPNFSASLTSPYFSAALLSEGAKILHKKLHTASRFRVRNPGSTFYQVSNHDYTLVVVQQQKPRLHDCSPPGSPATRPTANITEVKCDPTLFPPSAHARRKMQGEELAAEKTARGGAMLWPAPRAMLSLLPQQLAQLSQPGTPGSPIQSKWGSRKQTYSLSQNGWHDGEVTEEEAEEIRQRQQERKEQQRCAKAEGCSTPLATPVHSEQWAAQWGNDALWGNVSDEDETENPSEGSGSGGLNGAGGGTPRDSSGNTQGYVLLPMYILGDSPSIKGVAEEDLRAERKAACRHIRDSLPAINRALNNGEYDEVLRFAQRSHKSTSRTGLRCLRSIFTQLQAVLMDLQCLCEDPESFLELVIQGAGNVEFCDGLAEFQDADMSLEKLMLQPLPAHSDAQNTPADGATRRSTFQFMSSEKVDWLSSRLLDDCAYCLLSTGSAVLAHVSSGGSVRTRGSKKSGSRKKS